MKDIMNLSKKITLGVAAAFLSSFAFAQTLQEGIANADSHKSVSYTHLDVYKRQL